MAANIFLQTDSYLVNSIESDAGVLRIMLVTDEEDNLVEMFITG